MMLAGSLFALAGGAAADVDEVRGGAFGYFSNIGLSGNLPTTRGPEPSVTLPSGGSVVPIVATEVTGVADYGSAFRFDSGVLTVSTQGTTGVDGSVTSSANVLAVGPAPLTATSVTSTCRASEAGVTASTEVIAGLLVTSVGDPAVVGDETTVPIPAAPDPNTFFMGTLASGDAFTIVFNELIFEVDGSITVNGVHLSLSGPTAVGDLFIAQSRCGVTPSTTTSSTSTTEPTTTSTTEPTTTSTVATTTTTTEPTTTSTVATTTTTEPTTTTTTTEPTTTTTTTEPTTTTTTVPTTTSTVATTTTSAPTTTSTVATTTTSAPTTTTTTVPTTTSTVPPTTTTTTVPTTTSTVPPITSTVATTTTTAPTTTTTTVSTTTTTTTVPATSTTVATTSTVPATTTTVGPPMTVPEGGLCGLLRSLAQLPLIGFVFRFLLLLLGPLFGCAALPF
jgi:hypothetical protein